MTTAATSSGVPARAAGTICLICSGAEMRFRHLAFDDAGCDHIDSNPARRHLSRQRFRRAVQRGLRRRVIHLPAIAEHRGDRRDAHDAPIFRSRHRQHQPVRRRKTVERNVDHARPLFLAHARQRCVVVDTGVVDEQFDRTVGEH